MGELAAGLALALAVNAGFFALQRLERQAPLPRLDPETAVETAGLLSLGMRRMAADLDLVRLLVYYGSPEPGQEEVEHEALKHGFNPQHPELYWGGGHYPQIYERARRILELDPTFSYAVLYGAAALAFNLNRSKQALDLLSEGLALQPGNAEFRAYVAAVGFAKSGDTSRVLLMLEPTLAQPDCPTMIKSMVAFMYKRAGRRRDAIRVYRDILETSRDQGYRDTARRSLGELGAAP